MNRPCEWETAGLFITALTTAFKSVKMMQECEASTISSSGRVRR